MNFILRVSSSVRHRMIMRLLILVTVLAAFLTLGLAPLSSAQAAPGAAAPRAWSVIQIPTMSQSQSQIQLHAKPRRAVFRLSAVRARVTSRFGRRYHPILRTWRLHTGIDFAGRCGAPVRAAAGGTVVRARWAGAYGKQVVIRHGIRRGVALTTTYSHLSRFVVTRGRVARGRIIARVGTTGRSTGCHLHLETRQNGKPVNPRRWF